MTVLVLPVLKAMSLIMVNAKSAHTLIQIVWLANSKNLMVAQDVQMDSTWQMEPVPNAKETAFLVLEEVHVSDASLDST